MKKLLPNLALLLFGIVAGLAIAEGIARVLYPGPWYERLIKEQLGPRFLAKVRLNALGLRDQDYAPTKPAHSKRVLILGDSFTFGSGVLDESAIFPRLLEKQVNVEFAPRGTTIQVLNAGLPGSLTSDWVQLLEQLKESFQPDVILIVFFLRDGTRTSLIRQFVWPIRDELVSRNGKTFLYQHSYLFRIYRDNRDRSSINQNYARALNESYFGDATQTREWKTAQRNILKIKALGAQIHAHVGLVVFPVLNQLNEHYPFKRICELITDFGTQNEIPTHNLLPAFLGKNAAKLWVSPANQHPNARGHEITASSILPFLRQLLKD